MPSKTSAVALFAVLAFAPGIAEAQGRLEHPRLHTALLELREARRELQMTKHDFGGHKEKATLGIDNAVASIKKLLGDKGRKITVLDRKPDFYKKKFKDYPHLRQALIDLRDARKELTEAKGDFGGQKKRTMSDIDFAIDQIQVLLKNARV